MYLPHIIQTYIMNIHTYKLPSDPYFQSKLKKVKDLVENGDEDDTYFLKIDSCPVVSMYVKAGKYKSTGSSKRDYHIHFEGEPEAFPKKPAFGKETEKMGYQFHLDGARDRSDRDSSIPYAPLDFGTYKELFHNVCRHIDRALHDNHGIKTYEDGNVTNTKFTNVFYLHVCDIFNIFVSEKTGVEKPLVLLQTPLLEEVKMTSKNDLIHSMLTDYERQFLFEEIDFFYMCYAYFGNFSFVPLRTYVNKGSTVFKKSKFFMNNNHFVKHQRGKLMEIHVHNEGLGSKIAYRTM